MIIKVGGSYEKALIKEAREQLQQGGLKGLALMCYQSASGKSRSIRDCFFAGLAYSEFFAETTSDQELCLAVDYREVICQVLGIAEPFELYKMVENMFQPGRYK